MSSLDVTIVTATFNSAATIADTVRSVRAQQGVEVEHIIIDGASKDDTLNAARHAGHDGPLVSEPDAGIYDAMNRGLKLARGTYIGFLNSDDYFASRHAVKNLISTIERHSAAAGWGNVMQVDALGRPIRLVSGAWASRTRQNPLLVPPHPSFYMKTGLLRDMGGFSLKYRIAGDFDLLRRLFTMPGFNGVFLNELSTVMRVGGASAQGLPSIGRNLNDVLKVLADRREQASKRDVAERYAIRAMEMASAAIQRLRGRNYMPKDG